MTCYELEEDLTGMLRSIHSMEKMLCQVLNGKILLMLVIWLINVI